MSRTAHVFWAITYKCLFGNADVFLSNIVSVMCEFGCTQLFVFVCYSDAPQVKGWVWHCLYCTILHYTPLYSTVCTALYSSYTPLSVLHYTPLYSTVSTALYSSYTPLSVLHYTLVILHCSTTLSVLHYKNRIERWLLEGFQLWCCMLAVWWWGNESAEQEAVWVRARKNWRG